MLWQERNEPLGKINIDALMHIKNNGWLIIKVEYELNYNLIGQILSFKNLFKEIYKQHGDPLIICSKADENLKKICEIDVGIKIIQV